MMRCSSFTHSPTFLLCAVLVACVRACEWVTEFCTALYRLHGRLHRCVHAYMHPCMPTTANRSTRTQTHLPALSPGRCQAPHP